MITNQPVFYRKIQYFNPATKEPFYMGEGTPHGAHMLYFIPNRIIKPNIILKMEIINAHPQQEPFKPDTVFRIRRVNFNENIIPAWNTTVLDFMPIIDPFIDIFAEDQAFMIYVSKPAYFYFIYSFAYDKIGLKELLPKI